MQDSCEAGHYLQSRRKKSLRNGKATHLRGAATEDWWLELRSLKSQANALSDCVPVQRLLSQEMLYANLHQETALQS